MSKRFIKVERDITIEENLNLESKTMANKPYEDHEKGKQVAEIVDAILALDKEQLDDLSRTLEIERPKYFRRPVGGE